MLHVDFSQKSKKMKILYDYQVFIQRFGGISRYAVELFRHLSNETHPVLPKILSDNIYLRELGWKHYSFIKDNHSSIKYNLYKFLNIKQSLLKLHAGKFDVFHPLFINPYFIGHTNKPVVITMHDLNHDKFPDLLQKSDVVIKKEKDVCKRANKIIAISEETKLDLMKFHDVPEEKIKVIYHGMDQNLINCKEKRLHENPYLLYIGGRKAYKNFETFLKGFSLLDNGIDLVCTGAPFSEHEINLMNRLGIQNRVFQKFVSDDEMNNLYFYAEAFVYPSLGEGFGFPILEAYRCSCPCIVSDLMCFHEVGGNGALYFDKNSPDDMAYVINNALSDTAKLTRMREEGKKQLAKFTWEKCAKETEEIYKDLI